MPNLRRTALALVILILALALGACTRSASAPPATTPSSGTASAPSGQQATMEAVRSALLTQTAQAAAGKSVTNTPKPAGATPTPGGAATSTGGTPAATSVVAPTAINLPATARPACPYKYIVKPGDRLFRIGLNLGYDAEFWEQIASANSIVSPWLIYPGQELTIPCPN